MSTNKPVKSIKAPAQFSEAVPVSSNPDKPKRIKRAPKALTPTQQVIHDMSERIVKAQQPILILNAIKWDNHIKDQFFRHQCKELPKVDQAYYAKRPLGYDPQKKIDEFYQIEHLVRKNLGQFGGVSQIMQRMCREYRDACEMLINRGTPKFSKLSQQLYGSSEDAFYANAPTLNDLAKTVTKTLHNIKGKADNKLDKPIYSAEQAVKVLGRKLSRYFSESAEDPRVVVSDDIVADAAAGAECIKMRADVMFSKREIRQLEVHEGWVHLGTTLNGKRQPICTFLGKGAPSSTTTQEGLAILVEILTYSSFPKRMRRITNRVVAINMAEQGADFLDVFRFYLDSGIEDVEAYQNTVRVFRGSFPTGKPFTKDLSYTKGFVEIFNYIRLAISKGLLNHIPLLFAGKTSLDDMRILVDLVDEGLVKKPKFIPLQFKDLGPLCAWASFSLFINKLDPDQIELSYQRLVTK